MDPVERAGGLSSVPPQSVDAPVVSKALLEQVEAFLGYPLNEKDVAQAWNSVNAGLMSYSNLLAGTLALTGQLLPVSFQVFQAIASSSADDADYDAAQKKAKEVRELKDLIQQQNVLLEELNEKSKDDDFKDRILMIMLAVAGWQLIPGLNSASTSIVALAMVSQSNILQQLDKQDFIQLTGLIEQIIAREKPSSPMPYKGKPKV